MALSASEVNCTLLLLLVGFVRVVATGVGTTGGFMLPVTDPRGAGLGTAAGAAVTGVSAVLNKSRNVLHAFVSAVKNDLLSSTMYSIVSPEASTFLSVLGIMSIYRINITFSIGESLLYLLLHLTLQIPQQPNHNISVKLAVSVYSAAPLHPRATAHTSIIINMPHTQRLCSPCYLVTWIRISGVCWRAAAPSRRPSE